MKTSLAERTLRFTGVYLFAYLAAWWMLDDLLTIFLVGTCIGNCAVLSAYLRD